jgi:hypothetical protein
MNWLAYANLSLDLSFISCSEFSVSWRFDLFLLVFSILSILFYMLVQYLGVSKGVLAFFFFKKNEGLILCSTNWENPLLVLLFILT